MILTFKTFPVSTNDMYAHVGRRRFITKKAKERKEAIAWEARTQHKGMPYVDLLSVKINLKYPDRRKHDVDNIKGLLDALSGILWEDDSQINELYTHKAIDKENPGILMEVSKYRPL